MVCSRALGFVLLFLLPLTLGNEIENLLNLTNRLHETYGNEKNSQYALAINVPARHCKQDAKLDQNFLSQDSEQNVKNALNCPNATYIGTELIAAKPCKKILESKTRKNKFCHSEYLLLRNTTPSYMKDLLDTDAQGCTVFFTMNSPCVEFCSTPDIPDSIIPGLEIFKNHNGPKAFVFRQVWHKDANKGQLQENIKTIDEIIPVYKCSKNECVRCVENGNVTKVCIAESDQNWVTTKPNESVSLKNNE